MIGNGLRAQHDMLFGENAISLKRNPSWTCPVCGTVYYCVGPMTFCPACRAAKDKLEQEYWDNKRAGMRSVASEIVARILANK